MNYIYKSFANLTQVPVNMVAIVVAVLVGGPQSYAASPDGPKPLSVAPNPAVTPAAYTPTQKGVTDVRFDEFFVNPIGAVGLQFTDKLQKLNGKRVRISGYMVRQENQVPGAFLLSPVPVQLHEEHYGLADDLPAATLFVSDPANSKSPIPYAPGLIHVSGILQTGNREEANGRISSVRLALDRSSHDAMKKPRLGKGGASDLLHRSPKTLKQ